MTELENIFNSMMTITTLADRPPAKALELLAHLTDASSDLERPDGARHALKLADSLDCDRLGLAQLALLEYFRANAWACAGRYARAGTPEAWQWEQQEVEKEILHLRKAMRSPGFTKLPEVRRCQIWTNTGNVLNHVGRFVEALEFWNRALQIDDAFGNALGNRGICLTTYAQALYDDGHAGVFLRAAHQDFSKALEVGVDSQAIDLFTVHKQLIESALSADYLREGTDLHDHSLGDSKDEIVYREWCLGNTLFVNPLNDLGSFSIASHDVFSSPSIVIPVGDGPYFHGFFNQIKQEYCSARWVLYEAISAKDPHFSDRGVLLYNTLDYPSYSLAAEKLKLAFRAAYSLFDKAAFFLNAYLALSIPERKVSLRGLWYVDQQRHRGIRPEFHAYENWPLRGLYWLAKDLFEDKVEFRRVMDPDAKELSQIRNHLEHKYLKLHEDLWPGASASGHLKDSLAHSVTRRDFEQMALRLLKLGRAALIYLSLGIHQEERHRRKVQADKGVVMPMYLDVWKNDWKR